MLCSFSLTLANFHDSKSTCGDGVEDGDDDGGDVQSYPRQWVGQRPRLSINCVAQPALIPLWTFLHCAPLHREVLALGTSTDTTAITDTNTDINTARNTDTNAFTNPVCATGRCSLANLWIDYPIVSDVH